MLDSNIAYECDGLVYFQENGKWLYPAIIYHSLFTDPKKLDEKMKAISRVVQKDTTIEGLGFMILYVNMATSQILRIVNPRGGNCYRMKKKALQ